MYGAVPPPVVTVALPVLAQAVELLLTSALAVTPAGAVIVILAVAEHPALSETVTVYVPADRPVAFALVFPPGFHE